VGSVPDAMIAATALCYQLQLLAMDKNLDKRVKLIAKGLSKGVIDLIPLLMGGWQFI